MATTPPPSRDPKMGSEDDSREVTEAIVEIRLLT